jgi:hypothetical protein
MRIFKRRVIPKRFNSLEQISASNKWLAAAPLGYAYAKAGRRNDAWKILAEMDALPKSENLPAQERALIYLGLGDNDSTFVCWKNLTRTDSPLSSHLPAIRSSIV